MIAQLDQTVRAGKYDQAWQLFSSKFTNRVKQQAFHDTSAQINGSPQYGGLSNVCSNGHLAFEVNVDSGQKTAVGMTIMSFGPNAPQQRIDMVFKQMPDGTWKIDDIPLIFPRAAGAAQSAIELPIQRTPAEGYPRAFFIATIKLRRVFRPITLKSTPLHGERVIATSDHADSHH